MWREYCKCEVIIHVSKQCESNVHVCEQMWIFVSLQLAHYCPQSLLFLISKLYFLYFCNAAWYSTLTWTLVDGNDNTDPGSYSGNLIGARAYASVSTRMMNDQAYIFGGLGYNDTVVNGLGMILILVAASTVHMLCVRICMCMFLRIWKSMALFLVCLLNI